MVKDHRVSLRQACKELQLSRSTFSYQRCSDKDELIIEQLRILVDNHPSIGFWSCYHRLRKQGYQWNHKRVYKVYTKMQLNIRRRSKKRLPARAKQILFQPERPNQVWSIDFMSDSLWDGRKFRLLNILDDYNRQVLAIETDTSIPALRVIRTLERLKLSTGLPEKIRVDNGPEFISFKLDQWCKENKVFLAFIQPGKPTQNAYIERLNGSLRKELLNAYVFRSLHEVREKVEEWVADYNNNRPHKALKYKTPNELK